MTTIDPTSHAIEDWRPGVRTRMRVSALTGATRLCIFEQWCDPGAGAPTHRHTVEEVLTILEGEADLWVEETHMTLAAGQSAVIPAHRRHGFRNTGPTLLHVLAILAAPIFEATFDDRTETTRRWAATAPATPSPAAPKPAPSHARPAPGIS